MKKYETCGVASVVIGATLLVGGCTAANQATPAPQEMSCAPFAPSYDQLRAASDPARVLAKLFRDCYVHMPKAFEHAYPNKTDAYFINIPTANGGIFELEAGAPVPPQDPQFVAKANEVDGIAAPKINKSNGLIPSGADTASNSLFRNLANTAWDGDWVTYATVAGHETIADELETDTKNGRQYVVTVPNGQSIANPYDPKVVRCVNLHIAVGMLTSIEEASDQTPTPSLHAPNVSDCNPSTSSPTSMLNNLP